MNKKIRVIPAILTDQPAELERMLRLCQTFTDFAQIDIMDGRFVPSRSISWKDVARAQPQISWEVHLMTLEPEDQLAHYRKAGACRAIFHGEASAQPERIVESARRLGLQVGMALNPETTVGQILPLIDKLDSLLIMSVHPGFYGARYLPEVLDKVRELRSLRPGIEISIDGGIKENNVLEVARSGVNSICVGSAIFLQSDPAASFRKLQEMVDKI